MPWIAPVVAHVDALGYLFCTACRPEMSMNPVHGDQYFGEDDKCERCGTQLVHVPTSGYVHVDSLPPHRTEPSTAPEGFYLDMRGHPYVPTGEVRPPCEGEFYIFAPGHAYVAGYDFGEHRAYPILRRADA